MKKIKWLLLIPVLFVMLFLTGCNEGNTRVGVILSTGHRGFHGRHFCGHCNGHFTRIHSHRVVVYKPYVYRPYHRGIINYRRPLPYKPIVVRKPINHRFHSSGIIKNHQDIHQTKPQEKMQHRYQRGPQGGRPNNDRSQRGRNERKDSRNRGR